jgi:hypothetical protein
MTGILCALLGTAGASGFSGTAILNSGYAPFDVSFDVYRLKGYDNGYRLNAFGSMTNYSFGQGVTITRVAGAYLEFYENGALLFIAQGVYLRITTAVPNSGWSSINIGGTTLLRTNASYTTGDDNGPYTEWGWSDYDPNIAGLSGSRSVSWG